MSLFTPTYGDESPGDESRPRYKSLMANLAFTVAVIVLLSPLPLWIVRIATQGATDHSFAVGMIIVMAISSPITILISIAALREIRHTEGLLELRLEGRWQAWLAMALALIAPFVWFIFLTWMGRG
jgi:amino acid transporter